MLILCRIHKCYSSNSVSALVLQTIVNLLGNQNSLKTKSFHKKYFLLQRHCFEQTYYRFKMESHKFGSLIFFIV